MHLKMSSGKWRPPCLGLNVLIIFAKAEPPKIPTNWFVIGFEFRGNIWVAIIQSFVLPYFVDGVNKALDLIGKRVEDLHTVSYSRERNKKCG